MPEDSWERSSKRNVQQLGKFRQQNARLLLLHPTCRLTSALSLLYRPVDPLTFIFRVKFAAMPAKHVDQPPSSFFWDAHEINGDETIVKTDLLDQMG
jgi:hypothetical protein